MQAGGLGFLRWEMRIAFPDIGTCLETGCVFNVEAWFVLQIVCKEFGFNLRAVFLTNGRGVVEISEMASGGGPRAVAPRPKYKKVLVLRIMGFQARIL